jgi:hypothetical protein
VAENNMQSASVLFIFRGSRPLFEAGNRIFFVRRDDGIPLWRRFPWVCVDFDRVRRPLMLRRVPPNCIYGVRVKATYADEWVWYEANAAGGRDALCYGIVQLAAVFVPLVFLRPGSWTAASIIRANRLLKQRIASGAVLVPKPPGR